MEITIDKLLPIIDKGVYIRFEERNIFNYGFPFSHFEIFDYINPADGDPWDVLVLGYDAQFQKNKIFLTSKLIGIILVQGGNHKLVFKIPTIKSFNKRKFEDDIKVYMANYKVHGLGINYVEF
jgi:inorganic pyrophosphatase